MCDNKYPILFASPAGTFNQMEQFIFVLRTEQNKAQAVGIKNMNSRGSVNNS
jgi:hypothetical protein